MKCLLVDPHIQGKNAVPPLGLAYIAGTALDVSWDVELVRFNYDVEFVDSYKRFLEYESEFISNVVSKANDADIVGITITMSVVGRVGRLVSALRNAHPKMIIVAGGGFGKYLTVSEKWRNRFFSHCEGLNAFIVGEGEETFRQLLLGTVMNNIPNIFINHEYKIIYTGIKEVNMDVNTLPYPYWFSRSFNPYNFLRVLASRGCIYFCNFCEIEFQFGKRYMWQVILVV